MKIRAAIVVTLLSGVLAVSAQPVHALPITGPGMITPSAPGLVPELFGLPIAQIADGISSSTITNGFAASDGGGVNPGVSGTIFLALIGGPYDVDGFTIWNDVNLNGQGVKDFQLDLVQSSGTTTVGPFLALTGPTGGQTFTFPPVLGVTQVNLVVLTSYLNPSFGIEVREVELSGVLSPTTTTTTTTSTTTTTLPPVADHMKCYKIKDKNGFAALADLDSAQFGLEPGCKVKGGAKLFCVPVTKTVTVFKPKQSVGGAMLLPITGPELTGDSLCYKIKCVSTAPPTVKVEDQFGRRDIATKKAFILCTPARKVLCGNGVLDPGEQCDDGNLVDGDGCSSVCSIETSPTGGPCSSNSNCSPTDYCPKAQGDCNGSGTCATKPFQCTQQFAPVCGCDGLSYQNACSAAKAGVSIGSQGLCACEATGGICTVDPDCCTGNFCSANVCTVCQSSGTACGSSNQCCSNSCMNGFCN